MMMIMIENVKNKAAPFNLSSKARFLILSILVLGSFMALLNQTLLNVAIPELSKVFDLEVNTVQWLSTGFIMVNGIVIPITAYLIGKFSTRQLFISSIGLFTIGTILSALAPSFSFLLAGRLLQAAGAGVMMPLVQFVIFSLFPPEKRGKAMGMIGIAMTFAPAIGPTLSGWILQHYSWRVLFYIVIPIGIINLIFALIFLRNVTEKSNPKFDFPGVITSTIGLGSLLYGFSMAGSLGWRADQVIITIIIGVIFISLFIWCELVAEQPMLNLSVFKNKQFSITIAIGSFVALAMYSVELLTPVYIQNILGHSTFQTGLIPLPGAILMGIMSPIAGIILDRYGIRPLTYIGMSLIVVTSWLYTTLSLHSSLLFVSALYSTFMFGISFIMMTVMTYGLNQLPQSMSRHGAAAANTARMVSGSIGTALLTTIMSTQTKNYLPQISSTISESVAIKEASILGMQDAFLVTTTLAVIVFFMTLFLKRKKL
ncbi:DHA2 family efflux MFS transporter permease subunit [Metabacillus sediminilitoris]|uniref:DHA2 family efflux MFS transporter permease subunit n=2 Tax=Metabacillus sediminilitoris TaxID=2567941 RepID=A0A4V3WFC5_9BACI|nr:DHA2 family efflux MFS transporter permease subunit [Metabacillus sediminilitoris]THF79753.1 DHA2 family efflux MFS transporter permease subunit [Metabacillus sediminilitoris]